ncbi:MAG: T9SS type A sorting domain-containing protein [Bacteroidetes bacterium]|nr:T9SS type A sorting domain-containing protein [Bacteroidota bacterium]
MKKSLLLLFSVIAIFTYGQRKVAIPPPMRSYMVTKPVAKAIKESDNLLQTANPYVANRYEYVSETEIGQTVYDLQSNTGSPSGRSYLYPDGKMAAVWTRGMTATAYNDRGTGYNFFDGTAWGPEPTTRVETQRAGWPGYAPAGPNGEIITAHHNTAGLIVNRRTNRNSGTWTQNILAGPTGAVDISWPRIVSSGANHDTVHIIATTYSKYMGQNLALLYYRSNDAGATWSTKAYINPAMDSTHYVGFSGDSYVLAEPYGSNIAFLVADSQLDMFIMKSSDNGTTWTKNVIWEHPYPMLDVTTTATDTIYAPDGAAHMSFDKNGKLHVVFGVYRVLFNGDGTYSYWPGLSGIGYWDEDMPTYTGGDQKNILNPDSLDAQNKLVGYYYIDWNGNGTLDYVSPMDYGDYGIGWASMPQIAFDDNNNAVLLFSSITENFDNGTQQYRHIWARASSDNAQTWGQTVDLDSDPVHTFDECVFPTIAQKGDGQNWYFAYQYDNEPGLAVRGDLDAPGPNYINYFSVSTLLNDVKPMNKVESVTVSQCYPNPFAGTTSVDINLPKAAQVSYTVCSVSGVQFMSAELGQMSSGRHLLAIDGTKLSSNIYFLTLNIGGQQIVRKIVVK